MGKSENVGAQQSADCKSIFGAFAGGMVLGQATRGTVPDSCGCAVVPNRRVASGAKIRYTLIDYRSPGRSVTALRTAAWKNLNERFGASWPAGEGRGATIGQMPALQHVILPIAQDVRGAAFKAVQYHGRGAGHEFSVLIDGVNEIGLILQVRTL